MRSAQLLGRAGETQSTRAMHRRKPADPGSESALGVGGVVLGRYRLAAPLGAGGFASVWMALDERLEREVAVKIIPKQRVSAARFEREVWAAARLSHPAIVTLYEAAATDHAAYLVSELVKGHTLEQALAAGQLSDRDVVAIGLALCDALAYAHAEGIVHRDVKPSNVLVPAQPPSATPLAKLTDFGVARAVGGDSLTATGDVIGTAAYMAPEQAAGREAGASADLYSLALVLYEGLTGVNPLASITTSQRSSRLGLYLPPLRRQRRELPRELGRGIDLALRPRPAERGSVPELREALELSLPAMAVQPGVVTAPWRPHRRTRCSEGPTAATGPASHRFTAATVPLLARADAGPGHRRSRGHAGQPRPWSRGADPERSERPRSMTLQPYARALSAVVGAVLTGWLAAHALAPSPLAPAAAALVAAGVLLALPRAGYVLVALSFVVLAAMQGHSGEALLIALAAFVPIAATPRANPLWTLPGGAPLLGALGLAGAWPAIAATAASVRARAVLGMVGWVWLALTAPMGGGRGYVALSSGTHPFNLWTTSPYDAVHQVLGGLLSSGALAPAPVWAVAAALLPVVVKSRSLLVDISRVALWAGTLVICTELAISAAHFGVARATLHGVVVGAIGAAVIALAPSALAAWRKTRSEYLQAELP